MNLIKHLLQRKYDPTRYKNQVLDLENNILSVYLSNLNGQLVGYQQYRAEVADKSADNATEGRYFTYTRRGVTAVWGLETLNPEKDNLFVVEGIFKASALHMLGHNALAVLTSNPKSMRSWLRTMPYNLIGIGDGDKAGKFLPKIAGQGFQSDIDLDEYRLEELDQVLKEKGYG